MKLFHQYIFHCINLSMSSLISSFNSHNFKMCISNPWKVCWSFPVFTRSKNITYCTYDAYMICFKQVHYCYFSSNHLKFGDLLLSHSLQHTSSNGNHCFTWQTCFHWKDFHYNKNRVKLKNFTIHYCTRHYNYWDASDANFHFYDA